MDTYEVRKNDINDFKYIVFKRGNKRYQVQKLNATDVYLWIDKSALENYENMQLLEITKSNCDSEDFDALYNIAINYLVGITTPNNQNFSVSVEFVINTLQARYNDVEGAWGSKASQQLWGQVLGMVEMYGLGDNVTSPSEFVDNYLINGEFVSKDEAHWWLGCDSEGLSEDDLHIKWLEYCENNACLYDAEYACLSF